MYVDGISGGVITSPPPPLTKCTAPGYSANQTKRLDTERVRSLDG